MTIQEYRQSRLSVAYRWLEISADNDPDEAGRAFQLFTRVYIKHLLHLSGVPSFRDDLDHCQTIKDALRGTGPVYAALASLKEQNGSPESPETISRATAALVQFLALSRLEVAGTIRDIESQHPELIDYFASERQMFADWLADKGPLAGTEWEFSHE